MVFVELYLYCVPLYIGLKGNTTTMYSFCTRADQCIDKEILISKDGNVDIDIDKRVFLSLILIRACFDH